MSVSIHEDWAADMSWQGSALCARAANPNVWFPTRGAHPGEALAACDGCPVRAECLTYALAYERECGPMPGVWGGMTVEARKAELKTVQRQCARPDCLAPVARSSDGKMRGKYCTEEHKQAAHREAKMRYEQDARRCKLPGCESERRWADEGQARGPRMKFCSEVHRREYVAANDAPMVAVRYTDDWGRLVRGVRRESA